ncbi:MAG: tRNA pseudouridine(13) synthase TruD [Candidatus Bathyarchaeota archaeon]|nr:MAG: tRNA pseudouridine(13) synthase TruD [Candidatus Bathyarchaeota archaeon]
MANAFKLAGKIRTTPSDFIVEEIWDNRICKIGYSSFNRVKDRLAAKLQISDRYLHFTLVKENWDTIRALNYIRKKIGVSLKRFGISGMKDKQAITAQRVSLWKGTIKDMIR